MSSLYDRDWRVTVGTLQVDRPIDVAFHAEKTVRGEPNTAAIRIWNLAESNRRQVSEAHRKVVRLEAGYVGARHVVFQGEVRRAWTERDGADLVTVIEAAEGGRSYAAARINRSYPPGTSKATVVRDLVTALGLGLGNSAEAATGTYSAGTVVSGLASAELTGVLASLGYGWSVQAGAIQVLRNGQALQGTSVFLSPDTGLVGSPVVDADGTLTCKMLIMPDVYPGRQLRIESEAIRGPWRAVKCTYEGDSFTEAWYIEAECKELVPRVG